MSIRNIEVRDIFNHLADFLELKSENPFRVRAYREAARVIEGMSEQVEKTVRAGGDLTVYSGIGKDLAGKIKEIVETGRLQVLEDLKTEIPEGLCDLMRIPELGPRKVAVLYERLGIRNMDDLKQAAESGAVAELKGFGEKTEQKILESLGRVKKKGGQRMLFTDVEPYADALETFLSRQPGVKRVAVAGSFRRGKETIGDLDILAACREGRQAAVMRAFATFEDVSRVIAAGPAKSSVRLRSGLQVDLRMVPEKSYGAALHYFTGSKAHNIAIRRLGIDKDLRINEYGVYQGDIQVAGETEESVYRCVDIGFIPPELRENLGEIEAARAGTLPELILQNDIRGDLHVHTRRTDGRNTLREMAEAAKALGYEYLAITEHSQKVAMAGGLTEHDLREHMAAIDAENETLDGITLLKGIEVDILADGSLDLPDSVLRELDLTVASAHYYQRLSREKQTERIIRAMDNPRLKILGHPTGRLINSREPMEIDLEKIIQAAAERGVVIELNAQPDRLDLPHTYCKLAAEIGVKIAISSDAHSTLGLNRMKGGITEARRGWLKKEDVINTRPLKQMLKLLRKS